MSTKLSLFFGVPVMLLSGGSSVTAQVAPPQVSMEGRSADKPLPVTPGQGSFNTKAFQELLDITVPQGLPDYPKDSLSNLESSRAASWLKRFTANPVSGMQLDNMARITLVAGQDVKARQHITERLATPNLTSEERLSTLLAAFTVFTESERPDLLEVAKGYLVQVNALKEPEAALFSYHLYARLARIYQRTGAGDSVVKYGVEALNRFSRLPSFWDRDFRGTPFITVAEILSVRPGGRAEIDRLAQQLKDANIPTPEMLKSDPQVAVRARSNELHIKLDLETVAMLGNQVPKVVAHYWLNRPHASNSLGGGITEQSLTDGKIRIVELGNFGCQWCQKAFPMMSRLDRRYTGNPKVEVLYVTNTLGGWGIKALSPKEEVDALKDYYLGKRKFTFPIAIWAPERETKDNGDFMLPESPNNTAFAIRGTPRFCVVDGQGRLRHVVDGFNGHKVEEDLINTVEYLLAESGSQTQAGR